MNYAGESVGVEKRSDITGDPALSLWTREGLTLPKEIVSFREQVVGDKVAMVVLWRPEPRQKAEGEI